MIGSYTDWVPNFDWAEAAMNKPVRTDDNNSLPLSATVAIGALALFGAVTLLGWIFSALIGLAKTIIAVVVIVAIVGWIIGRRAD